MSDAANRLIDALEREAELVDGGGFTIDEAAAQAKLARYRMAEPEAWPCLIVEAARLLGARRIAFETGLESMKITFDGEPLVADEVFGRAAGRGHPAERKLAVAFHTLFDALAAGTILIESAGVRVRLQPEGLTERTSSASRHTVITVLGLRGTAREQAILIERCRYSPFTVTLDFTQINHGLIEALRDHHALRHAPLRDAKGDVFGFIGVGAGTPTLVLLTHGVLAESLPHSYLAVVDVPLAKDLGEHKVLRDEAFERLLADIEVGLAELESSGEPLPEKAQRVERSASATHSPVARPGEVTTVVLAVVLASLLFLALLLL